ncbi:MAG: hypothetical protein K940chlam7_00095 [Chlamydiae bacterium]|nr:hypothetical protein [Chlamydiota bacterium]
MTPSLGPSHRALAHKSHEVYELSETALPNSNKHLKKSTIEKIDSEYQSLTKNLEYNTLAPMLELISWMREHRQDNYRKAINDFSTSAMAVLEKYQGGSPALIAAAFSEKMEQMGYRTDLVGESHPIAKQFYFPAPGNKTLDFPLTWEEAKNHLDGITHYFLAFQYSDTSDQPRTMAFRKYFTNETPIKRYENIDSFKEDFARQSSRPLQHITDRLEAIKSLLQINFKYFVIENQSREVLRVDILNGTLSVIPGKVEGMVQNIDEKVEFDFANLLEHPDEFVQVFLGGQNRNMKKGALASLLLSQVKSHFHFPSDFSENLCILMKERASFIKGVMVNPAETIYNTWELYKKTDYLHQLARYANSITSKDRGDEPERLYHQGENEFIQGVKSMQKGDEAKVCLHFSKATSSFNECLRACSDIQREPLEIILDSFQYF